MRTATLQFSIKESEVTNLLFMAFPDTKFRIETSIVGYYNVISIMYVDGVSCNKVRSVIRHLKQIAIPAINFPGIRFEIQREMSLETTHNLLQETQVIFDLPEIPQRMKYIPTIGCTVEKYMRMIFSTRDF